MAAQLNLLADNCWVAGKRTPPKRVANEHGAAAAERIGGLAEGFARGYPPGGLYVDQKRWFHEIQLMSFQLASPLAKHSHIAHLLVHAPNPVGTQRVTSPKRNV